MISKQIKKRMCLLRVFTVDTRVHIPIPRIVVVAIVVVIIV